MSELLQGAWFVLVGFFFAAYTVLDGFDLGIGILFPFLGRTPDDKRTLLRIIAPVWDGNEVWLLAGIVALFAAFPPVYATVLSGFYLTVILVLFGLILRAVSFEFWAPRGRHAPWDLAFFFGSLLPTLLLGVALGNVVAGVPLTATGEYAGDLATLLRPFPLAVGLFGVLVVLLQGASYAAMKTSGALRERARRFRRLLHLAFLPALAVVVGLAALALPATLGRPFVLAALGVSVAAWVGMFLVLRREHDRRTFLLSSANVAALWAVTGALAFPNLVAASNDAARSLTAYNASSGEATLTLLLAIALVGLPIVIAYTVFAYRVFRDHPVPSP